MINIEELQTALEKYEYVIVNFRTKSGKIRRMECTRNLDFIDPEDHYGINDFRLVGPLIIAVWDWEHSAWRSFRKDSVIDFRVGEYAATEPYDPEFYDGPLVEIIDGKFHYGKVDNLQTDVKVVFESDVSFDEMKYFNNNQVYHECSSPHFSGAIQQNDSKV